MYNLRIIWLLLNWGEESMIEFLSLKQRLNTICTGKILAIIYVSHGRYTPNDLHLFSIIRKKY